jgi:hypothetical protein
MTILVPALQKSREATYRAVCASNQRQLSVSTAVYQVDADGFYPPTMQYWVDGTWQKSWLHRLVDGNYIEAQKHGTSNYSKYFDRINNPALKCPKLENKLTETASTSYAPDLQLFGILPKPNEFRMTRMSELENTSKMIMYGTKYNMSPNWAPFSWSRNGGWHSNYSFHPPHLTSGDKQGMNLVMTDSHVEFVRYLGPVTRTWPATYIQNGLWQKSYHWKRTQQGLQEKW